MAISKQNDSKGSDRSERTLLRRIRDESSIGLLALTLVVPAALVSCGGSPGQKSIEPQQPTNFSLTEQSNPSQGGTVSPGSGSYPNGQGLTISEIPAPGYQFIKWEGSGNGSYTGPNTTSLITMNNNLTETADYQPIQETLTLVNNGCLGVSGGGTFNYGTTEQFSASIPTGYTFSGWSSPSVGGYSGTNNPSSVTLDGAITETATCTALPTVAFSEQASPLNDGTVSPGPGNYQQGQKVQISEIPAPGYQFTNWQGTGLGSYSGTLTNPPQITMNNNITEIANYLPIQETLTLDNNGCLGVSGSGTFQYGTTEQFSASVPTGYTLLWTSQSLGGYSGPNNPASVLLDGSIVETANCSPTTQQQETLTLVNNECLSVSGGGTFNYGTTEQFSASVPTGYTLLWTSPSVGGYSGTNNPSSVTLDGTITETATCTTTQPPENGTIYALIANPSSVLRVSDGQVTDTISINGTVYSMIMDQTAPMLYVGETQSGTSQQLIQVIDTSTNSLLYTFPTIATPTLLGFNSDSYGTALYITGSSPQPPANNMQVINNPENSGTTDIVDSPVPIKPTMLTFSNNKLTLYIASDVQGSPELAVMPTFSEQVNATIPVANAAFATITPSGAQLWASAPGSISVIDTSTNEQIETISIPGTQSYQNGPVVFTSDGTKAYVGNSSQVSVIDTQSLSVTTTIPGNTLSEYIAISPDSNYVYVPNIVNGSDGTIGVQLDIIRTSSDSVVASIPLLNGVQGYVSGFDQIMFSVDGTKAYIFGGASSPNTLYVINTSTLSLDTSTVLSGPIISMAETQQ